MSLHLPGRGGNPGIVGWSALSPIGTGREAFSAALHVGTRGVLGSIGAADDDIVPEVGYPIAGFDPVALLGDKGTRTLDRMTMMVIAATTMVLTEQTGTVGDRQAEIGLVLGTSTGSLHSITQFVRDTFVQAKPYFVNPANFPNTVMNGAAGRTAIWHGLRGLNSTVSGGHVTGLAALRYATRMLRRGYADLLLVGAVEELSPPVAWAAGKLRRPIGQGTPLGEGCAMFLLAAPQEGAGALAEVVDFEFGNAALDSPPELLAKSLTAAIGTLLRRTGITPAQLWAVCPAQSGDGELDQAELAGIEAALGGASPRQIVASQQLGNTFSALGSFQVAAALAVAQREPDLAQGRPVLITSLGVDGAVACALLWT